ncbi:MAG TPA: hypothetical protein VLY23_13460 [Candidatus Acidoferrum sp.]|nr:hypothetical protein [Candidatus Acidoferrum sp.]
MSLPAEERAEMLAVLAADSDAAIAERAKNVALTHPLAAFITAISRPDADSRLFTYCSDNLGDKPGMADALAKNPGCPTSLVARVAPHLTSAGIQVLLDNLEWLTNDPELVLAVCQSKAATPEQREMLDEMQKGAMSMKELEEAAEEVEPDPVKRKTMMQKLAYMTVVQRITLALKGGREERMLLIRDPNKLVQKCVLQSPRLTDTEVESFAAMANLTAEVLRTISLNRVFMKNYSVAKNLVMNPKTPLDVSLHLFPRLTATDLVKLTTNKNVPETLRSMAQKLHRKRKQGIPD